jgi:hypothetical protein
MVKPNQNALPHFRYLQFRARNFVHHPKNWMLIEALAEVLLERQTLSGDEVDQVIRATFKRYYFNNGSSKITGK